MAVSKGRISKGGQEVRPPSGKEVLEKYDTD
jgi:hypothetical protein